MRAAGVPPGAARGATAADRLAALVPLPAAQRGLRPGVPDEDDVVDPYGGTAALYRTAFDQLAPAVAGIARAVSG